MQGSKNVTGIERLESRLLLSSSIQIVKSTLYVNGTAGDDHIIVNTPGAGGNDTPDAADLTVTVEINGRTRTMQKGAVKQIVVNAGSGDDVVELGDNANFLPPGGIRAAVVIFTQRLPSTILGAQGDDLLIGGWGSDRIAGGAGRDSIDGLMGDDVVSGDGQDDIVYGGAGFDGVYGGKGNDTLVGDLNDEIHSGDKGLDYLFIPDGESRAGQPGIELRASGPVDRKWPFTLRDGVLTVSGTRRADTISIRKMSPGNIGLVTVNGVSASISADGIQRLEVFGGRGDDSISLAGEDSVLDLSLPPVVLPSRVEGGDGNDSIVGGWGDDRLIGGRGNDRLVGLIGHDTLDGGAGADTLRGDAGNDEVTGGIGIDAIFGGDGKNLFNPAIDLPGEFKDYLATEDLPGDIQLS